MSLNPRSPSRRQVLQGTAAAVGAASFAPALLAQAAPVRVGYSMSRTGPWTGGAQVSQEPNFLLWAEQQNQAGGLDVKGVRRRIHPKEFRDAEKLFPQMKEAKAVLETLCGAARRSENW